MLPLRFFQNSRLLDAQPLIPAMYFGMFGSIFLLAQFLQFVQGYSPFQAGLRMLPWTVAPIFVAPIAGALSDRIGGGLLMGAGLALQAIGARLARPGVDPDRALRDADHAVRDLGIGMGLFFAPVANVVLSAVRPEEEGQASGANNAIREVGGVFGVAVLAAIFSSTGGYAAPQASSTGSCPRQGRRRRARGRRGDRAAGSRPPPTCRAVGRRRGDRRGLIPDTRVSHAPVGRPGGVARTDAAPGRERWPFRPNGSDKRSLPRLSLDYVLLSG